MSKDELIKLLQKKENKIRKLKANDKKKRTSKGKQNLEELFDDDPFADPPVEKKVESEYEQIQSAKPFDEIDERYRQLYENMGDVINYPMKNVSLDEFRKEEAKLTNNFKKGSSFVKLFGKRIRKIRDVRVISITLFVNIDKNLTTLKKSFGPFQEEVPKLSLDDMYKFMVYALLKNDFKLQSAEFITAIGARVITFDEQFFMNHRMGRLKLETHLLNNQKPIKSYGEDTCVLDFVWHQVRDKRGFKTYDYDKLKQELYKFASFPPLVSTAELIEWAKNRHSNVSIHAFDSTYRKFTKHIKEHPDVSLAFIVKDHHCYPITDDRVKEIASKANHGGASDLLKYMCDLKWTRRHENVSELKSVKEVSGIEKENNILVLPEDVKMTEAARLYIQYSQYYIEYLHWNNNGIFDGFIDHKKNMYLLNNDYRKRKSICDRLFKKYKTEQFIWTNQSFTNLASSLFKQMFGYLPESTYNVHTREILDDYYPRALQWCTTDEDIPDDVVNIDISKCYPDVVLNNESDIPIYDIHNVIEPFKGKNDLNQLGEFYIDETVLENFSSPIKIEAGFYTYNLVRYLVSELKMPMKQIRYKITTKRALKPDTFKGFIKYLFDEFPEKEAKMLANSFIGELGRKYNKTNRGFTCTDKDTVDCVWTRAMKEERNVTVDTFPFGVLNNIYLIKEEICERIFSDNTSINRFVISQAILRLLQLIGDCHGKNSVLYGYNTDGIFITNPKIQLKNKKDVKFKTKHIGEAFVTDTQLVYFEKHYRENLDYESYKIESGKGCIFTGAAGSGKTTKLCEMVLKTENPIVLSFTNKAVENVKQRLKKMGFEDDPNKICHTFDSYFFEWKETDFSDLKKKTIFVDEFSMVSNKWMTKLYESFVKYNNTIYLFGDPNQCEPVEGMSQIQTDYLKSTTVKQMCPNIKTLEYITTCSRYDDKTYKMLSTFLKHGTVNHYLNPIGEFNKNICYLNKTRISVNSQCCDRFVQGKKHMTVNFKYNGGTESYKICEGMPFIATTNIKEKEVFNMMEFKLLKMKKDEWGVYFQLNDECGEWYSEIDFGNSFVPAFCVTVYKYQGSDINENYNIYDVDRMDIKQLYTALSRTTKLDFIHLNFNKLNTKYKPKEEVLFETCNVIQNTFQNGKIYKVTFNDKKIYIGSTCNDLNTRFEQHMKDEKSQVFMNKNKNPQIKLIVNAPCFDKKTLEKIENGYITYYAERYGDNLINIRGNPIKKAKKIEYKVEVENEKQLRERIAKLDEKINIKDNVEGKFWFYDVVINGKRYKTMARYKEEAKEIALENISNKKNDLIKQLSQYFE